MPIQAVERNLTFSIDEATSELLVKVYDVKTGELIRRVPPEYLRQLVENIQNQNDARWDHY